MTPVMIHGQPVQTVEVKPSASTAITRFQFAPGIGASTVALEAVVDGKVIQVFPNRDFSAFEVASEKDHNLAFKQFNVPLFPLTNRLLPKNFSKSTELKLDQDFNADVEGISVKSRANNQGSSAQAIAHHLHGFTYSAAANSVKMDSNGGVADFKDFFKGYWVGTADLQIHQSIEKGEFHYEMTAKNTGKVNMPVAFGSHPYFQISSGNPKAVKLKIPAHRAAVIDNYENVLPNGESVPASNNNGRLDFSKGKALPEGVTDNFFFLDSQVYSQSPQVELIDEEAKIKYVITGLTSNIIGAQVYYPGNGSVVAVELVTNVPDPRHELWKNTPTGMKVLKPGETAKYAYKIAVEKL